MPFISFSCLIDLARFYNIMLNRSDENGHPFFGLNLREKYFKFSPLSIMLAVSLVYMAFIITLRYGPSIIHLGFLKF